MIDVSFKANSPLEAIGILEAIQRHQQSTVEAPPPPPVPKSTVEAPPPPPVPKSTVEAPPPPPVPKSTVEAPPPVPKSTVEAPPPVPKSTVEAPPVPKKFDIEKTKAKIGEELTRIVDSGNAARPYLTDKGYSGVDKIPESKLVAFLEMLKGEHVSG